MKKQLTHAHAHIEYLKVENFRALRSVVLQDITPLTVLLGPNGSGKSTIFDVFGFLAECFETGLRRAWDKRGKAKELRTRGSNGAISIELRYREREDLPVITYHLEVDEKNGSPAVKLEWLQWKQRAGYFSQGLRKIEAARQIGKHIRPMMNTSPSFRALCSVFQ